MKCKQKLRFNGAMNYEMKKHKNFHGDWEWWGTVCIIIFVILGTDADENEWKSA